MCPENTRKSASKSWTSIFIWGILWEASTITIAPFLWAYFIISLTFIIGAALAAIGILIYLLSNRYFRFDVGSVVIGLYPFVAAVIGGIGSLPGAVLGGLLIGLINQFAATYGFGAWADFIIYGIFVVILLFKPAGLLGKDVREKV